MYFSTEVRQCTIKFFASVLPQLYCWNSNFTVSFTSSMIPSSGCGRRCADSSKFLYCSGNDSMYSDTFYQSAWAILCQECMRTMKGFCGRRSTSCSPWSLRVPRGLRLYAYFVWSTAGCAKMAPDDLCSSLPAISCLFLFR